MIEFFESVTAANLWMSQHPEWKPIGVGQGAMTGSVLVVFEPAKVALSALQVGDIVYSAALGLEPHEITKHYAHVPKRRGRPPKVKVAV